MSKPKEKRKEPKLKPCPFCGSQPKIIGNKTLVNNRIVCNSPDCDMSVETVFYTTREEAIDTWNTRNDDDY